MKRQTGDDSPADCAADTLSPLKSEGNFSRQIVPKLSLGSFTPLSRETLDNNINSPRSFGGEGNNGRMLHSNVFTFGESSTALFSEKK